MNQYPNGPYPPYEPNNPYSQPTTSASYPQFLPNGSMPPYPQPGQFGPPPISQMQQKWYREPWVIIALLILFFPIGLYLMWRYAKWSPKAKWIVTGIYAFLMLLSAISNASANNSTKPPAMAQVIEPTATQAHPTPSPTDTPTPTPSPTPTPTPAPIQQSAQQPVQQSQPVEPPAKASGVNGNPWGYNFTPGSLIYDPNSGFCSYFSCVTTFWKDTNGYVVECGNGKYSHSGGVKGACSEDGGVEATLYQH